MGLINIIILLALSSIVFAFLTLYLLIQLKLKKKKGKTLQKELTDLSELLSEKEKDYSNLSKKLKILNKELNHLLELEKNENKLRNDLEKNENKLVKLLEEIESLEAWSSEMSEGILSIKEDISIYQPVFDLMNVGFFDEPDYLFGTSERFKEEIKTIRELQKSVIKDKRAIILPTFIALTSNQSYAKKVLDGQTKLMLKAFNVECDNLMSMIKPSNYAKILERIDKLYNGPQRLDRNYLPIYSV